MSRTAIAEVLVIVAGIALTIYFLVDDTIEPWLIRLSWAGAITAGFAAVVLAIGMLADHSGPPRSRQP